MIIAGWVNFKLAALPFVHDSEEAIKGIVEKSIAKSSKDANEFGRALFKKYIKFLLIDFKKPFKTACLSWHK